MRIALCQINPTVGDLDGNASAIADYVRRARENSADLVVFPEMALTGYPPKDLLLQGAFVQAAGEVGSRLGAAASVGLTLVFGTPLAAESTGSAAASGITNSLVAWQDGRLVARYDKRLLPTYDVFDENRYFVPGDRAVVIEVSGVRVGLSICEDLWRGDDAGFQGRYRGSPDPVAELVAAGATLIINPSASPFRIGIGAAQRSLLRLHAARHGISVAAVNQVGGNDELIFDGSACVIGPDGSTVAAGPSFEEAITLCELPAQSGPGVTDALTSLSPQEALYRALVLGVKDYCRKTGFRSAVLGLSGGIDSAVVAVLAAAALGPGAVHGVSLPSRYSSEGSRSDAAELARRLGVAYQTIPIEAGVSTLEAALAPAFAGRAPDVTEENLQSRVRGTILMALSNKFGHILLTTGNKSEMAVGYATLYGDMNGGLAVISDVPKMAVYALAEWINLHWQRLEIPGLSGPPIPADSISKPPSAELRPGQTDQDSLPPYAVLDEIIERYVSLRQSPHVIAKAMSASTARVRADTPTIKRVVRLIDLAEYKRKQAAVGLKVSSVSFGSGRRVPIAQGWRPEKTL